MAKWENNGGTKRKDWTINGIAGGEAPSSSSVSIAATSRPPIPLMGINEKQQRKKTKAGGRKQRRVCRQTPKIMGHTLQPSRKQETIT